MTWSGCRKAAGLYLSLFFLAVVAAPHHHLNGLEDLLLDQRSDSGVLVQTNGPAGTADAAAFRSSKIVQDVPCLACFTSDFVAATTSSFVLVASFAPLPLIPVPPLSATPELVPADTSSRAPPSLS
jgi:hypothetical protein